MTSARARESLSEMLKLRRAESVNLMWGYFAGYAAKIDVPLERQFRMMPALHQI